MGKRLRKGISPALSVLIIASIAVVVSIAVGYFLFSQTQTMASKGATLQIMLEAHDAGSSESSSYVAVTVTVKNTGPEDVKINSITIRKQGSTSTLTCTWTQDPKNTVVKAGATASYSAICSGASVGQKISVYISAETTRTKTRISASTTAEVQP